MSKSCCSGDAKGCDTKADQAVRDEVSEYYGRVLQKTTDLQTNACCTGDRPPAHLRAAIARVADPVLAKYYGCGLVAPAELNGLRVVDLGCGSGRDCYVMAQLVGAKGHVTGVDMTDEQLDVAKAHMQWHAEKFGYANTTFVKGFIERLQDVGLEDESTDLIISNCVINLSPDKEAVLREAYRVLKLGGELYFSDVYADRRVPKALRDDPVLFGECISGALYWNDFINLAKRVGFADPRLVTDDRITISNADVEARVAPIRFFSATFRLWKLDGLEPHCEDYGQAVVYKGSIEHHPHEWALDDHHVFPTGKVFPVCGNTWRMLHDTRFAAHFDFVGSFDTHYGIFDGCGTCIPFASAQTAASSSASGGCC